MTDQLSPLAVQNAPLLRAIDKGPYGSRTELAGAADILVSNLNRKLESLAAEGLIVSAGEASHEVALTDLARRALAAIDVFEGAPAPAVNLLAAQTLIAPHLIDPSPFNPRKDAADSDIPGLAMSIADKGVLEPIVVRRVGTRFELVAGERRWRASVYAIEQQMVVPHFTIPAQVRDMTDDEAFEAAGVENLHREDFHWLDEAQWYLGLAERGRSAAQIIRLIGEGGRKKRTIQQFIQVARELDDDAKTRARLPEGDPTRLSLEQCRFMVGNKRERPALELSPKMALAMVELIVARREGELKVGAGVIVTRLHNRPQGGALTTLADRGLTRFYVGAGHIIEARTDYTVDLDKWLTQIGFLADPMNAMREISVAAIGELSTARVPAGRYLTPELNPPERGDASQSPLTPAKAGAQGTGEDDDADPFGDADDADDEDADPFGDDDDDGGLGREIATHTPASLAGRDDREAIREGKPQADEPAIAAIVVPPAHALIISELAHRLQRQEETDGQPITRAPVQGDYYRDPIAQAMIHDRLLMFLSQGDGMYAALTDRACAWLRQAAVAEGADGRFQISDDSLHFQQLQLGLPAGRHTYMTQWLRPEEPADAHAVRDLNNPLTPAQAGARGTGALVGDTFSQQLHESLAAETAPPTTVPAGSLQRLLAAAREAKRLIELAHAQRLKPTDTNLGLHMLTSAMEDADRALKPQASA